MSDIKPLSGGFGVFRFTNNRPEGAEEVRWVPKSATNAVPLNPESIPVGATGECTDPSAAPMNECDVYIKASEGGELAWRKYTCTWPDEPATNWKYINFFDSGYDDTPETHGKRVWATQDANNLHGEFVGLVSPPNGIREDPPPAP